MGAMIFVGDSDFLKTATSVTECAVMALGSSLSAAAQRHMSYPE